jgi:hypothetical protein
VEYISLNKLQLGFPLYIPNNKIFKVLHFTKAIDKSAYPKHKTARFPKHLLAEVFEFLQEER